MRCPMTDKVEKTIRVLTFGYLDHRANAACAFCENDVVLDPVADTIDKFTYPGVTIVRYKDGGLAFIPKGWIYARDETRVVMVKANKA